MERLEHLKQKGEASAPALDELVDQMPSPPSSDPMKASSKGSGRGTSATSRKFMGKSLHRENGKIRIVQHFSYVCSLGDLTVKHFQGRWLAVVTFSGPLTSFLDADPDLTKAPQFTAYSSSEPSGGGAPPKPRPSATPTPAITGGHRRKGGHFTDTELKVLRYNLYVYDNLLLIFCHLVC